MVSRDAGFWYYQNVSNAASEIEIETQYKAFKGFKVIVFRQCTII